MLLTNEVSKYLYFCRYQKQLTEKTIRAYQIDLNQFTNYAKEYNATLEKASINNYIIDLHKKYKQKSVKRKIASIKAFFSYLESEEVIGINPFHKIKTRFREEIILPKTIQKDSIEKLLCHLYHRESKMNYPCQSKKLLLRDIAVIELLFATGLRISELCGLKDREFSMDDGVLCIKGKGAKERYLQVENKEVLNTLKRYRAEFQNEIKEFGYFFVNRYGKRFSEQSARRMIRKHSKLASLDQHITPHMFRHSFATLLLEEDVDIRYIQKMLGHSSIVTTQIYTYVTSKKQRQILKDKHPRNKMKINKLEK